MADSFYESALAKLEKLGHKRKPVARLNTGDVKGPTILSRDPKESTIPPIFIPLQNVQEAKELGGFPNTDFETGKLGNDLLPIPQAFRTEVTPHPDPFSPQICDALRAYIYGNSTFVQSYQDVLNNLRFPLTLTVHEGEDLIVTKGKPLIVKDDGHGNPIAVVFRKITVEPGGQIIWQGANGSLIAKELIYQSPTGGVQLNALLANGAAGTDGQNFVSVGAPGGKGEDGATPAKPGGEGVDGNPGKDNKNSCARSATDGTEGRPGADGGEGQPGERGGDGNEVNVTVDSISGIVYVGSGGGTGGEGGKGGNGADGGRGGNGGSGSSHCGPGKGKDGGKGGNAGKGGKGGDGGDGRNVYFTYKSGSPQFTLKQATGTGGTGGKAGSPGQGGKGGSSGGNTGDNGKTADSGLTGKTGNPGQVFINGKSLS
jgi:hypothetical protein